MKRFEKMEKQIRARLSLMRQQTASGRGINAKPPFLQAMPHLKELLSLKSSKHRVERISTEVIHLSLVDIETLLSRNLIDECLEILSCMKRIADGLSNESNLDLDQVIISLDAVLERLERDRVPVLRGVRRRLSKLRAILVGCGQGGGCS
jgi:hypothetical protein